MMADGNQKKSSCPDLSAHAQVNPAGRINAAHSSSTFFFAADSFRV